MSAATAGRVLATGNVVHAGRRHAVAEGRVEVEATSKLMATGTTDCPVLRPS
jgi:acyl-coenzyme A thioesterase PaaI-like protein